MTAYWIIGALLAVGYLAVMKELITRNIIYVEDEGSAYTAGFIALLFLWPATIPLTAFYFLIRALIKKHLEKSENNKAN